MKHYRSREHTMITRTDPATKGWTLDLRDLLDERTHSGIPPESFHPQAPRPVPRRGWLPWVLVAVTLANWLAVLKWLNS